VGVGGWLHTFVALLTLAAWAPDALAGLSVETLSMEKEAQPGESYDGSFAVTNDSDQPRTALVYQTDYAFFSDGSNQFGEPGTLTRSNALWISFSPRQVRVPPHQSVNISYRVKIPPDSTLRGTYWSMLMVEEAATEGDSVIHLKRGQLGIQQVVRYGIQCVTQIAGTGEEKLNLKDTRLVAVPNSGNELQLDVENVGDRWAIPLAWMELYDEQGRHIGRFESEKKRIYPGTSVRYRIQLNGMPGGKYKALVVLDSGDKNVLGAKYDLEF